MYQLSENLATDVFVRDTLWRARSSDQAQHSDARGDEDSNNTANKHGSLCGGG